MVKVKNNIGDIKTGCHAGFIYQKVNGNQVLRQGFTRPAPDSPLQKAVKDRFKASSEWVKNLTYPDKQALKQCLTIYENKHPFSTPFTWYAFGMYLYNRRPQINLNGAQTNEYTVKHPALMKIEDLNYFSDVLSIVDNLSNLPVAFLTEHYSKIPIPSTTHVKITTVPGNEYILALDISKAYSPSGCFRYDCVDPNCVS